MKKNLLFRFWILLAFVGLLGTSVAHGQTLKHSWTFDDGTTVDAVGGMVGTLVGTATVQDSVLLLDANGDWMEMDGAALDLNSYTAITLEHYYSAPIGVNDGHWNWTSYFGGDGTQNIMTATNVWDEVRMKKNDSEQLQTAEKDDGEKHYVVSVMTASSIKLYYDGVLVGENNAVGAIDIATTYAYLGRAYWNDPSWQGSIYEFNIWDGELDAEVIAKNYGEFAGLDFTNATLDTLYTSVGTMDPAFDPENDIYEITIPYGVTSLTLSAAAETQGAKVTIYDGLGVEITDGNVTFEKDGIDLEIIVTALDGTTEQSYYVSIFPTDPEASATLENIELSIGGLIQEFNMDSTSYSALVPTGTTEVVVTGIPNWSGATVAPVTVTLVDGVGSATLSVTSEDGTATMVYTVEIATSQVAINTDFYLVHEVSGFVATEEGDPTLYDNTAINQLILEEAVVDSAAQIWHFEESGVDDQYYIVNKDGNYLSIARNANFWDLAVYPELPSFDLDSARFILSEFQPGRFKIISVARQNESATNNILGTNNPYLNSAVYNDIQAGTARDLAGYTVWNFKDTDDKSVASPYDLHLSDLTISGSALNKTFNPAYREYSTFIPIGVTSIEVSATAKDEAATVTGTGTVDVSNGEGTITITVTATDPSYSREYVISYKSLSLNHSYTFEDGTANDVVGDLHGTVNGADSIISIADGKCTVTGATSSTSGYISLDAAALAISKYDAITVEAYLETFESANSSYTMLWYFGNNTGGSRSLWYQPTTSGTASRAAINNTNPKAEIAREVDDGYMHHVVVTLTYDALKYYLDGELVAETATGTDYISNIDNVIANIFKGPNGWADRNYNASLDEFNIYNGEMDAATVLERANAYLGDLGRDASLASLTVDVDTLVGTFDPDITSYSVVVPAGVNTVNVAAVATDAKATVTGAGAVDVSMGSVTDTITVTAEDGIVMMKYVITMIVDDASCAAEFDPGNIVVDPKMTHTSLWQGWGSKAIVIGDSAYCGASMQLGTGGTGCDAALDIAPFEYQPNTTYRVRAMVRTVGGSIGFLASGADPNFGYAIDTYGEWMQIDTTFTTGASPANNFVSFNKCDFGSNCTYCYVDNYEIIVDEGTAAEVINESNIKVYPTYSTGDFKVATNGSRGMITVYSLTGKLVLQKEIESSLEIVTVRDRGMYIMKVENEDSYETFKVFKTR